MRWRLVKRRAEWPANREPGAKRRNMSRLWAGVSAPPPYDPRVAQQLAAAHVGAPGAVAEAGARAAAEMVQPGVSAYRRAKASARAVNLKSPRFVLGRRALFLGRIPHG